MARDAVRSDRWLIRVNAKVERHDPGLPCFVVITSDALRSWRLEGTLVVHVRYNGSKPYRRTLKRWDEERWFIDLPKRHMMRERLVEGSEVPLELERAEAGLPMELIDHMSKNATARDCWERLAPARQRVVAEHVREARSASTRTARVVRWFAAQCFPKG